MWADLNFQDIWPLGKEMLGRWRWEEAGIEERGGARDQSGALEESSLEEEE